MTIKRHIPNLAELMAKHEGERAEKVVRLSTISSRVFDDGKVINRLVEGGTITLDRYWSAMEWFADNWPADLSWPADIPRPAASSLETSPDAALDVAKSAPVSVDAATASGDFFDLGESISAKPPPRSDTQEPAE